MSRFDTPAHTYFVALTVSGIRVEARAASISEACRYASTVLAGNRKATPAVQETADKMIRAMIYQRRSLERGALRTKISETGASIELTMDGPPKGWALKAGPRERTNFDAVPTAQRWK